MKTILFICIFCLLGISNIAAFSQEIKDINIDYSTVPFLIKNTEVGKIVNNVLPDVTYGFNYSYSTIPRGRSFFLKYKDLTYDLQSFNKVLLDIKYLGDSSIIFSDEDLIKTYTYLDICSKQEEVNDSISFVFDIKKSDITYSGQISDYYKRIGFNNFKLNYTVKATWLTNTEMSQKNFLHYEFNIVNSEIISINRIQYIVDNEIVNKRSTGFYAFPDSEEFEKIEPHGRKYRIEFLESQQNNK